MKRDMDLVRNILLYMEDNIVPYIGHKDGFDTYCQDTVNNHLLIMLDGGLIMKTVGSRPSDDGCPSEIACFEMTWEGHEFLDAARNESFWSQAKAKVLEDTGGLGFETLKAFLLQLGKQALE